MNVAQLAPDLRKGITGVPRLPFGSRQLLPLARCIFNLAAKSGLQDGVVVTQEPINGINTRIYTPVENRTNALILWFHGGGYIAGKPEHLNFRASGLAKRTGATVFAPQYRLAPKHSFPAGLDDGYSCWRGIIESANSKELDIGKAVIGGNSAGGGLAAALVQRLCGTDELAPCAQVLVYPMLDDRTCVDSELDALQHFIWNNKANKVAWSAYLSPHEVAAPNLPEYAVPARRENLGGLPRTWIGYGELDLFAKESREYASRLESVDVECESLVIDGAPHAFDDIVPNSRSSKIFFESMVQFINEALGQ